MITKIDFIEENYLTSYHIKYNKKKLGILKNKLKKRNTKNIIEVDYSMDVLDDYLENSDFDLYKILKTLPSEKYENREEFMEDEVDRKYGDQTHQHIQVKMVSFPILYHILFGKYKENNENFIEVLSIYLANDYGLRDENNKVLFENQKKQQYRDREPLSVEYDGHLTQKEKYQVVLEFLDSIEFFPITKESLTLINNQIDMMTINYSQKEKITPIKTRVEKAQENTKNLEKIYQWIRSQDQKQSKRRVKISC